MKQQTVDMLKHGADAGAVGITLGTISQILPAIAALFTIVWTGIRIWETNTVQRLFKRKVK